jgi:hypothetical protein
MKKEVGELFSDLFYYFSGLPTLKDLLFQDFPRFNGSPSIFERNLLPQ